MAAIGFLFFPSVLLTEFLEIAAMVPPVIVFIMVIVVQALFLFYLIRMMGSWANERQLVAFTFGLILPLAIGGVAAEIHLPLTLAADLAMVLFFRKLWSNYSSAGPPGSRLPDIPQGDPLDLKDRTG